MTVDATIPSGSTLMSDLVDIIVENRTQINALWAAIAALGGAATYESLSLGAGATELPLTGAGMVHSIALGAAGGCNITDISGGAEGQLLLIKATGVNITLIHNDAKIHLNSGLDLTLAANDTILLLNEGGVISTGVDGIWIEVTRTIHV